MTGLAFDAVLGMNVKVYDSSWIEWGNMSDELEAWDPDLILDDQVLVTGSPWALNNSTYSEAVNNSTKNTTRQVTGCELDPLTDAPNHTNENDKNACVYAGDDDDDDDDDYHHGDDDDDDWTGAYNQTYDCNGNIN